MVKHGGREMRVFVNIASAPGNQQDDGEGRPD